MTQDKVLLWLRGLVAAVISGAAGGVITGFAAMGIAPDKFNLVDPGPLGKMAAAAAIVNAVLGCAFYLKQSPLPPE